jgi:protein phosphatase
MPALPSDPNRKPAGLWGRLRGAYTPPAAEEVLPGWDEATPVPTAEAIPTAAPVEAEAAAPLAMPVAMPVAPEFELTDVPVAAPVNVPYADAPLAAPVALPVEDVPEAEPVQIAEATPVVEEPAAPPEPCAICGTMRSGSSQYCFDCGYMFPVEPARPKAVKAAASATGRLAQRYELVEQLSQRGPVTRWKGIDHHDGTPVPVILVQMAYEPAPSALSVEDTPDGQQVPLDGPAAADEHATDSFADEFHNLQSDWPGLGWEWRLLEKIQHPSLPRVLDHFVADGQAYLVEEALTGQLLWDAWEDPQVSAAQRYEWAAQIVEALHALHGAGAILEGLRPDIVSVTPNGRAVLGDLSDLLPLPLPPNPPIQATAYTAPELILDSANADCRSDLYSLGAMIYALYVGRELTEMDFERQGVPKPFVLRFPDAHPALARVLMKTFVREKERRFPTEEAAKADPSGFEELARTLRGIGRMEMHGRLDVACWTTTGMVRTNNEDAFALIHSAGSKQDDLGERILAILADGMGGYEAGEIASAMAIDFIRQEMLKDATCAGLAGDASERHGEFDLQGCQDLLAKVLRDTNKHVFTASRTPGVGKRGMGCTAEVVFIDGRRLVVGHVGDSRTYHYARGRLVQVTRDQTLVNRLVELGHLTPEEAENHPRKNELQQAIGGQPIVDPQTYSAELHPGDWVIVCSDGLTNHVDHDVLTEMIQRADSAEMCARRLVNLANLQGGSDNTTVVAVRVT